MNPNAQTDIFEYSDYRKYLADTYALRKAVQANFSHRLFARQAGLSSPSHLLMIIKGERNLSIKTIPKFVEGLKLGAKQKKYFELLVLFSQAQDLQAKAKYFSEMMILKTASKCLHPLEKERFDFLARWYVVAIYVLVELKDFQPQPEWIAKRLGAKITAAQAVESLETLLKLGLIERTVDNYRQSTGAITAADDTRSVAVFSYHQSMIRMAGDALRQVAPNLREMNGATISIPKGKLPELKEKIRAFRKEINQLASSYADADEIYQLNIQLFPLTEAEDK